MNEGDCLGFQTLEFWPSRPRTRQTFREGCTGGYGIGKTIKNKADDAWGRGGIVVVKKMHPTRQSLTENWPRTVPLFITTPNLTSIDDGSSSTTYCCLMLSTALEGSDNLVQLYEALKGKLQVANIFAPERSPLVTPFSLLPHMRETSPNRQRKSYHCTVSDLCILPLFYRPSIGSMSYFISEALFLPDFESPMIGLGRLRPPQRRQAEAICPTPAPLWIC